MKKRIALIGSTGSIGTQTLEIIRQNPDRFQVTMLSAGQNMELLGRQIQEFSPDWAVIQHREDADRLRTMLPGRDTRILSGTQGIKEALIHSEADMALNALVGKQGLLPSCWAIECGMDLALANKESLVSGGALIHRLLQKKQVSLIPVDSEHSAIFQCLQGEAYERIRRIILTASGGPFIGLTREEIMKKSATEALKHPNWVMGQKITIDSATMMNKGLEIIEASWLFDVASEQIEVVVHPQSIIHSLVEFCDTSILAQLGWPDMHIPIQVALAWPERMDASFSPLNLAEVKNLTFQPPDEETFPCMRLARWALEKGKTMPCVLNAANDYLVPRYLEGEIGFYDLSDWIETVMAKHQPFDYEDLDDLSEVEKWVVETLNAWIP